jgi:hypothetical protein
MRDARCDRRRAPVDTLADALDRALVDAYTSSRVPTRTRIPGVGASAR